MKPAAFLAVALAACALEATAPMPIQDDRGKAVRVKTPRIEWLAGYAGAELCSQTRGDVRKVEWYVIPGLTFKVTGSPPLYGFADGRKIYLAESMAKHVWLARHEALHTLGFHHHAAELFVDRCKADWPEPTDTL